MNFIRSGIESHLRGRIYLKNSRRVKTFTVRFTKLALHACLKLDSSPIIRNELLKLWHFTRIYKVSLITNLKPCYQQFYMKQRPKNVIFEFSRTMGNPSRRNSNGSGNFVRKLGRKCFSSSANISDESCVGLKELIEINKNNPKYINNKLIHLISDSNFLIFAYESIKSKPGNCTRGSVNKTLDGIDLKWFSRTSKELKAGKFSFKPARRIYVPKSGNKKCKRPLNISNPKEKIVQQAIFIVLNAIFEPSFAPESHGSRPNKGTHTALKAIKYKFQGVKWCIEADIENNFPSIDHKILLNFLGKRISCSKFLTLIKRSIKAGYKENNKIIPSNKGLSQGNIISPILNNIYLHELDSFISDTAKNFVKGKNRKKSSEYRNLSYQMEKAAGDITKFKKLRKKRWNTNSKNPLDPNFKRLYYIRYVDDFAVGIIGSHEETVEICNRIDSFLKNVLKLTLSPIKTSITHFSKNPIFFLGTFIKGNWEREKCIITVKKKGCAPNKVRMTSRVVFKVPIKSIFEKATANGFFKKRQAEFVPTSVGRCINLDHHDILRYYNSVIRGVLNYYSFVNNRKSLGSFVHGLKFSCARTLALKYKLRHASKIFKKFGSKLKSPDGETELFIPSTFKAIKKFSDDVPLPDDIISSNWNNKLTKSNLFKTCVICGSKNVEMHHVRKIRDLKNKAKGKKLDFFTMQMAAVNRKQIPLCSVHHLALHNNSLTSSERELFKNNLGKSLKKKK